MPLDQSTPPKRFWRTWRREIVRGGVLFCLVVGAGLFITRVHVNVHAPWGVLGSFGDFDWGGNGEDLFGGTRHIGDPWEFRSPVKPSQHVWIRNTNGPINVVAGSGDTLEVHAEKSWRNSSPGSVEVVAVPTERGVTICAMWEARERRCGDGGDYRLNGVHKNDVAVRFTVELPRGVPIEASTVNGPLEIDGVSAPVEANTVNGRILVNTAVGPIKATTINGSIEAVMQALSGGDVELTTVNGSVTAAVPPNLNATVNAETVNGRVETDFPVKITGKASTRHVRGTIGTGVGGGGGGARGGGGGGGADAPTQHRERLDHAARSVPRWAGAPSDRALDHSDDASRPHPETAGPAAALEPSEPISGRGCTASAAGTA